MLNFTPPLYWLLIGGVDFSKCISSLSIQRPIVDVSTPYSWTGTIEFKSPVNPSWLPENLNDLENPSRWARGAQIRISFGGILFATLRILEYYYDEDTRTGTAQVGDILSLLADEVPAKDYKGLGFPPCQGVSLSALCNQALSLAGFPNCAIAVPDEIPVPPNKPSGSWVSWIQGYLGERGYWLSVTPQEVVTAVRYPLFGSSPLFVRSRTELETFSRARGLKIPPDKIQVSGTCEKYASCITTDSEVSETFGVISGAGGRTVLALQRRETVLKQQEAGFSPGSSSEGMPIAPKSNVSAVQKRRITVEQALGAAFPDRYPGETGCIITEITTEWKGYDSQGRLRARYVETSKLLGLVLTTGFPGDRTMIDKAEKTLEEYLESIPGTFPSTEDGVLRQKETTFWTLFLEGTDATQLSGLGSPRIAFGGINYQRAIKQQTVESWSDGVKIAGDPCPCNRFKYKKRVFLREQEQVSAQEVSVCQQLTVKL